MLPKQTNAMPAPRLVVAVVAALAAGRLRPDRTDVHRSHHRTNPRRSDPVSNQSSACAGPHANTDASTGIRHGGRKNSDHDYPESRSIQRTTHHRHRELQGPAEHLVLRSGPERSWWGGRHRHPAHRLIRWRQLRTHKSGSAHRCEWVHDDSHPLVQRVGVRPYGAVKFQRHGRKRKGVEHHGTRGAPPREIGGGVGRSSDSTRLK